MKQKLLSKKHFKKIIPAVVLIALVIWFVLWTASPQEGKVHEATASQKTSTTVADQNLDGTYIAFSYSGKYSAKSEGPTNNDLEIHTLTASTQYDKRIIASVSNLPDGQIGSYGAYIYRKLHREIYTIRKVEIGGVMVDAWVKNDGSEQTIMVPRGNKVATITFTTASTADELTPEVDVLLKTFRWKE